MTDDDVNKTHYSSIVLQENDSQPILDGHQNYLLDNSDSIIENDDEILDELGAGDAGSDIPRNIQINTVNSNNRHTPSEQRF